MRASRIVLIIAVLGIFSVGGLYFFTDTFLSPYEKFIHELDYYESLQLKAVELTLIDYDEYADSSPLYFQAPKPIKQKVSKMKLREMVSKNDTFGFDFDLKQFTQPFLYEYPDLSYDQYNRILWVIEYTEHDQPDRIYWWSPQ